MKQKHLSQMLVVLAMILSVVLIGSASATLTDGQLIRGDVNGDNAVNMKDVLLLRKYLADMDVEFADHICSVAPSESTQPSASETTPSYTTPSYTQPSQTQPSVTEPSYTTPSETYPSYTQPSYTTPSETQPSYTTPSQTQPSVTQPSQSQPAGDTVTLSLNISEEAPRYNTVTHTDSFQVPKNQDATIEIVVLAYQDLDTSDMAKIKGFVNLTGATLSGNPVIGDISDHKYPITFTYKVAMDSDKTVSGTIASPIFDPSTIAVNGQGGTTPSQGSQSGSQATTEPSSYAPIEVEGTENYDLVTLTYLDAACSEYGLTFHSFADLSAPVIQIVEGPVADDAAFASARTISGASISESTASTCEYTEYDPTNYTFVHTYENRGNVVNGVTTHIYKAKLDSLDFGKTYSYRVGDTALGTYSPVYTFTTRPQTVSDFSFIYTADTQPSCFDGLGYLGVNALFNKAFAKAPNAQFLVSGGDFVYCSDEGQSSITVWRNVINGGNNKNTGAAGSLFASHPWFIANGNHDANKVQQFLNNKVTGTGDANDYYSYDYGDAHFVVLDSGHNGSLDTAQLNWLSSDLASTTKKWKVLFLHFSLYCSTDRDLGVDKTTLAERSDRQTLLNIIDTNKVDLVVSAHVNESYYTSYPLKGGAKTADVPTKTGGVDCYTSPSGTIYMQNGGSGLGSDLKGGQKGKLNTNTQDVTVGFRNRLDVLRDAEVGYEASYAVFDVSSTTLKVNRYYLDSGLNSVLYTNGQFQITK